ncbi:sulfite oxidase heme-binding subunit YedZ [Leucothrix arctica]|uniref:Protein-methionine-sulfoxide reductase heme-binding subunit MsrQ n=1 Tax=Leucothrix arctica TaxID=1481894 RepID=A0A317C6K5_9GAMM|nr:protein-methionine-sulfoxide reductase heme-binding subunit MsrQ [Leucothrix arctica]PWQ94275.1 sulfoxide reductase heme-binding subunit YedZ [Leucothrix arctica]
MHIRSALFNNTIKPIFFVLLLLPTLLLIKGISFDTLGANSPEYVFHSLGEWALRILLLTLLLSPLRRALRWPQLLQLRRMFGLFTFYYASLHSLFYLWFEQSLDWLAIYSDIWDRPFITAGVLAFLCIFPLAITSTKNMMRQMGRRWKLLHLLVYPAVIFSVIHFWWLVKADITEPLVYAGLMAVLFAERAWGKLERR